MKKTLMALAITASSITPSLAMADTILGLYAGIGQWNTDLEGDIGTENDPTKIERLGFEEKNNNIIWAKLEHPVPLIPNIMLKSTGLSTSSTKNFTESITLGSGSLENLNGDISTELDLSHIDATLYYEVLDNWVTLDVGLTARKFSGHFNVNYVDIVAGEEVTTINNNEISDTIPLLYGSARVDLPFTGFHVGLDVQTISISDNSITDTTILAGYSTNLIPLFDIGVNLGYRSLSLSIDELEDTYVDMSFEGAFIELTAHF